MGHVHVIFNRDIILKLIVIDSTRTNKHTKWNRTKKVA